MLTKLHSKLDDAATAKKIHGILTVFWLAVSLPIMIFLSSSIPFVVFISVYAIVAGHWAGWDAAGGELQMEKMQKDIDNLLEKVNAIKG